MTSRDITRRGVTRRRNLDVLPPDAWFFSPLNAAKVRSDLDCDGGGVSRGERGDRAARASHTR